MIISWKFQPNSIIFDIDIAVTRILGKFWQILGMSGQDLGKMIKILHNLPDNHEMIISWKFPPNSIIFDLVIAVTRILDKSGQILGMAGQDLGKNDQNAP